jgi:cyclohexanecarboxyl-CoA dehydrogenase
MMGSLLGGLVSRHAAPDIARTWTRRQLAGEVLLGIAVTEPQAGTDAANIQLAARRDGDSYVLSGEKTSISFCDQADALIVLARTGPRDAGAHGVTAFLVSAELAGLTKRRFNDLGHQIVGRGSVFFDAVRVPADHRLGEEGTGFTQVMQGFEYSRILLSLMCLSAAQASIDETWLYAREREVMGAPIASYQGVSFPLVEAESQVAACRALCYQGLALRDAGRLYRVESAMAKSIAPKAALDAIHQCIATFGHYAVSMDLPHQQRLRDVLGFQFGEGTAQAMKLIVARERAGRAAVQRRAK